MDHREAMVLAWVSGRYTATTVAARYEVSRPTLYTWAARYRASGRAGLVDRPPIARTCPHKTAAAVEAEILAVQARCGWGPKKLGPQLRQRLGGACPAVSTIGAVLARNGVTQPRRTRRETTTPFRRKYVPTVAGDLMSVDFKGQFRLGNGQYCYPLTIMEAMSRSLLACHGLPSTGLRGVWPVFVEVFRTYGLPRAVLSDNGVPFVGVRGLARISWLSVQLMRLGIQPVLTDPGHPEQNGAHERMHRTLAAAVTRPPAGTLRTQQRWMDAFRHRYNHERPHEALHQTPPAQHFTRTPRPWPARVRAWEYAGTGIRTADYLIRGLCLEPPTRSLVGAPYAPSSRDSLADARSRHRASRRHVRQDAAVAYDASSSGVSTRACGELDDRAVLPLRAHADGAWGVACTRALEIDDFATRELSDAAGAPGANSSGSTPMFTRLRWMRLKLGDDRAHAEEHRALAAQSRRARAALARNHNQRHARRAIRHRRIVDRRYFVLRQKGVQPPSVPERAGCAAGRGERAAHHHSCCCAGRQGIASAGATPAERYLPAGLSTLIDPAGEM